MPLHNLNPRFQHYIARARRVRLIGGTLLGLCLLAGTAAALTQTQLRHQLFATLTPLPHVTIPKPQLPSITDAQLAAAATSFSDQLTETVRNLFCRYLIIGCRTSQLTDTSRISNESPTQIGQTAHENWIPTSSQTEQSDPATPTENVNPPAPVPQTSPTVGAARSATATSQVAVSNSASNASPSTPPQTVVNQPVIERVVEQVRTVVQGGITEALLDQRLLALDQSLSNRMSSLAAANASQTTTVYNTVSQALRIEELSDLILHNPVIDGGSITASSISGTISAAIDTASAVIASLTATELVATNATTTNLYVSGSASLPTTSVSGDLTVSGTITGGTLAVSGLSSGGAVEAPYFTATSSTATSTFAGPILALGAAQFANSTNFFGETKFGATATTTIATDGTISTPSIVANSATLYSATLGSVTATTTTATSTFSGDLVVGGPVVRRSEFQLYGTDPLLYLRSFGGSAANLQFDGGSTFNLRDASGNSFIRAENSGAGNDLVLRARNSSDADIEFETQGLNRMSIKYDGNVGIASTSPYARLSLTNTGTGPSFLVEDDTSPDTTPFIIDASGNVGIGTASPAGKIHIQGSYGNVGLTMRQDAGDNENVIQLCNGASCQYISQSSSDDGNALTFGGTINAVGGLTPKLILKESGNVGIGTTSPATTLSVSAGPSGGLVELTNTNSSGYTGFDLRNDSGTLVGNLLASNSGAGVLPSSMWIGTRTDMPFHIVTNGITPRLTINSTGNVGIGTTSPEALLHIYRNDSSTGVQSYIDQAGSGDAGIGFRITDTRFWGLGIDNSDSDKFKISHTEDGFASGADLTIDTSGNVGISTTSPWRTLSVTGTVGFDGLTGATGAGSLCLDSNKQVVYNSASDSCLSSTRATKHDINPLTMDALEQILGLQPVSFVYNEGDAQTRFGFIAEDTAAVDAHLATYDASGTISGIDDRAILSVVVKAIQSLAAKIADLATTIANFAQRVTTREICLADDAGTTCYTRSQLGALLGQSAGAATPTSVPSSPSNTSEPETPADPPISVSSTTPDLTEIEDDITNPESEAHENSTPELPTDDAAGPPSPEALSDDQPPASAEPTEDTSTHEPANDNSPSTAIPSATIAAQ